MPSSLHTAPCFYQLYFALQKAADGSLLRSLPAYRAVSEVWHGSQNALSCCGATLGAEQGLWRVPVNLLSSVFLLETCRGNGVSGTHTTKGLLRLCPNSPDKPLHFRLHCFCTSYFLESISGDLMPLLAVACRPFAITNPKFVEIA